MIAQPMLVKIWEVTGDDNGQPDVPRIFLQLITVDELPCVGQKIDVSVKREANTVRLALHGIMDLPEDEECFKGSHTVARFTTSLELQLGSYTVELEAADAVDRYTLSVTDTMLVLDAVNAGFTEPVYPRLYRYPQLSFVYGCETRLNSDKQSQCDAFADSLESHINLVPFTFADTNTAWPYHIRDSINDAYVTRVRFYRYASEADFDSARVLLEKFADQALEGYYDGIWLVVRNWMGAYTFIGYLD